MAIDRKATQELINAIDELAQQVETMLPKKYRGKLQHLLIGPAKEEFQKLIIEGRPPRIFLIGRAGHGKSSLINAMVGRVVARTNVVEPETMEAIPHSVSFEGRYASWDVVDTRGVFEAIRPEGKDDAVSQLRKDLLEHRPDMILHVISAPEVKALGPDLETTRTLVAELKRETQIAPCLVAVLNRVDTIEDPAEWPPEDSAIRAGWIKHTMDFLADDILKSPGKRALDSSYPFRGYELSDECKYRGIVPVRALSNKEWNIDSLISFIGNHLPDEALLDFGQAINHKWVMKRLADSVINRFSIVAGGIGAAPIPVADIAILIPLQLLMIGIIGGLSCRPFSKETIYEYLGAAGVDIAAGTLLRMAAQEAIKILPGAGMPVSASIAASGTWAIGKAASAYFFKEGTDAKPTSFFEDAKEKVRGWWKKD